MALAGSPAPKLPRRRPRRVSRGSLIERVLIAGLFVYLAIAVAHYPAMAVWPQAWTVLLAAVTLSALWWAHLEVAGMRRLWGMGAATTLLLFLAGPWLRQTGDLRAWISMLGCGLFVYAMVWIYAVHEREPGLQPLATAALVLSIGVLAKPPVVAGCACLSLAVFIDERRHVGGWWRSTLLILTPMLLCASLLGLLNTLWAGGLVKLIWGVSATQSAEIGRLWSMAGFTREANVLLFPLGILVSQLLEGRTRKTALAYLFLIAFVGAIGTASWMPLRLTVGDLTMIVVAGACSLLALDPPRHWFCRLLAMAGMVTALGLHGAV